MILSLRIRVQEAIEAEESRRRENGGEELQRRQRAHKANRRAEELPEKKSENAVEQVIGVKEIRG